MKILSYKCSDINLDSWEFSQAEFQDINLLVGNTGVGKSRFLNTIFNLARFIYSNEHKSGIWEVSFLANDIKYEYNLKSDNGIIEEKLVEVGNDRNNVLFERNDKEFLYIDKRLPRLTKTSSGIFLLKDEELINPIYESFNVLYRKFGAENETNLKIISQVNQHMREKLRQASTEREAFEFLANQNLNTRLILISNSRPEVYKKIMHCFKEVFPTILNSEIKEVYTGISEIGSIPVIHFIEKNVTKPFQINELSSGMFKVLSLITDINIIPEGCVFLLDEYENSLGVNAIDFLPALLLENENRQFFISSHHPYIINQIPVNQWYVFARKGSKVSIKYGEQLIKEFGNSKQSAFIKLNNSSYYSEGIE